MARRRKNRTHLKGTAANADTDGNPKSFVVKHGQVGASLTQLVRDMRKVLEPNTASRLKERSRNKLKDYLVHAPALHVTHLLAFTLTSIAPSLRIVRLSAGPTLSFRIERYSLIKDILNTRKRARSMGLEYLSPPLLVLASFPPPSPTTPPHLTLLVKSFQSLFPSLSPQNLKLSSARRVVLIAYNAESDTIDFRHYLITIKPYGVSKRVRRLLEGKKTGKSTESILNLGREQDVADFLLRRKGEPGPDDDGYESAASSASSVAEDEGEAISLADDYVGRNNKKGQRKAVRLDEIGPRMELRLVKIVEGVPGKEGSVIHHGLVKKTKAELASLKAAHAEKLKLRQQRREEQDRNVERKKKLAGNNNAVEGGSSSSSPAEDESEGDDEDTWVDEEDWNEEGDVSEGEESGEEEEEEDEDEMENSVDGDSEDSPPPKKGRTKR